MIYLLGQGALYQIHKHKQRWLTEAERRKAFCYFIGLFACLSVLVYIWILS